MKTVLLFTFLFSIFFVSESNGQAQDVSSFPNFDDVVSVDAPVIVYRDNNLANKFYLVPQTVLGDKRWSISVIYQRKNSSSSGFSGSAVLNGPSLIDDETIIRVKESLKIISEAPELIVVQPQFSEYRVKLFGSQTTITDRFVINPISENVSVSFYLDELPLRALLHDTSYIVDVGILTFKFSVRGVEYDSNFNKILTRRWFNIHSPIDGNCINSPEKFLNVITGQIGCIYNLSVKRADIILVQRFLYKTGYYKVGVDGVLGPFTKDAIKSFQRDQGFYPDGLITGRLIEHITSILQSNTLQVNSR